MHWMVDIQSPAGNEWALGKDAAVSSRNSMQRPGVEVRKITTSYIRYVNIYN